MTEQTEKNPTLTTNTATPTLTINREHAAIHLAILGDREKYLLTIKDLANDKGHNEEKTKVELITFTEETNNKGLVSWVSLNPKVSDGTVNVTALAVFWLDIDAERPKERAADQYELQEAYDRALALKNYFEKTYNAVCFIAFSGNGYHLYFPLPITAIAPETRETVNLKVRAFAKNTAVRVNKVIDTTYDINRKTTLIGSYNLKYGNIVQTYWLKDFLPETQEWALKSVENARHKNQSLLDAILDTSTEQQQTTKRDITKPHLKLEEILKQDQKLNDLYNGNWKKYGYPTRSEAEAAVLTILFGRYGVSTDEAQEAMKSCKIGKWQEKPGSYQDITLQKAQKWIIDQDEDFKAKTEPIIPGDIKKVTYADAPALLAQGYEVTKRYAETLVVEKKATGSEQTNDDKPIESQADRLIKYCLDEKPELFFDQHGTQYVRVKLAYNPLTFLETEAKSPDSLRCCDVYDKSNTKGETKNNEAEEKIEESPKIAETTQVSQYRKRITELKEQLKEAKTADETDAICNAIQTEKQNLPKRNVIMPIESQQFRKWLAYLMYEAEEKVPGGDSARNAISVLGGKIQKEGHRYTLYNRVAPADDGIFLDICDDSWRAIKVTAEGWEIVKETPLPLFKRYAHQQPLAKPLTEKEKGDAWKLLEYINIKADDENSRLALLCSVISYFIPLIAHPAIVASGAQGTCKSWFFNVIRQVSDPSSIPLLTVPKDAREMAQHLEHNWLTPYDNISNLPDWASDMLCRAVTGGGIAVRELYTDDEDIILNFKRCVMLNGINVSAQRGDLLDRAMIFALEPISKRKTEKQLSTDFENAKSIILTGFLNVLSQALKIYPSVELKEIQRLSDFHFYGCAIAQALGKKQEQFSDAYREKVKQQNDEALTDQVALAVLKFAELTVKPIDAMDATGTSLKSYWIDQPSALFAKLNYIAVNILSIDIKTNKGWPRSPNALTRKINVLIPNLKAVGVEIVNYQGTPRKISIDAKKLIVKESPVDQQLPQLPQLTQLKQGGLEKNKLSNNPIIKPILPGVTEVSGVAGVVSEISKPKPQFMFKSIPAAEKCGDCSSFAVTKEVLTPQGATLRKCEECFKKLQTAFPNATFQEEGPKKLLSDL